MRVSAFVVDFGHNGSGAMSVDSEVKKIYISDGNVGNKFEGRIEFIKELKQMIQFIERHDGAGMTQIDTS